MKTLYPVSKTHAAFIFNVTRLFEDFPNSVYMWTFTFKTAQHDFRAMMRWNELHNELKKQFAMLRGIRVSEVHPGKNIHGLSHGIHFHCLFNQRVSVHWLRRIAEKHDFGRIHVRKVTKEEAMYIGKYLTKGQPLLTKGARRWGTIGWPTAQKVSRIKIDSDFTRNVEEIQNMLKCTKLSPDIIHSIFVNTKHFGNVKQWPLQKFEYSNRAAVFFESDDWRKYLGSAGDIRLQNLTMGQRLPRSNKRTREQSMLRIAALWKERARRASLGHEGRTAEDISRARQRRAGQAAGGGKNFLTD